jgi:hypothetical protein
MNRSAHISHHQGKASQPAWAAIAPAMVLIFKCSYMENNPDE